MASRNRGEGRKAAFTANPTLALLLILAGWVTGVAHAQETEDWRNLYLDARPVLDVRYRYEHVDQDAVQRNANAHTVRTRFGLETGRFYGVGVGVDGEWIEAIGDEDFNDTINGRTEFPVVADPDDEQLNQLFVVADGTVPGTRFKVGRQRIIWDNARFIGNVGFRQNEQTFDAAHGAVTAVPDTVFGYTYLEEVHRIFGTDSPAGDPGLEGHGIRAHYSGFEPLAITPFALLLDYDSSSFDTSDSQTYGILLEGGLDLDEDWRLLYAGSAAYQEDLADNPADFDLWYYRIDSGIDYQGIQARIGYEVLEGDGTSAFQTPLATLHKFNGLTDQFLTTPPDGLEDLYLSLAAPLPGEGWLADITVKAGYHQFWAEQGDSHYGSEWDAGIFKKFAVPFGAFNLGLQYASYDADNFSSDTEKLWLTLQFSVSPRSFSSYLGNGDG